MSDILKQCGRELKVVNVDTNIFMNTKLPALGDCINEITKSISSLELCVM